jgi:hypothetical protein
VRCFGLLDHGNDRRLVTDVDADPGATNFGSNTLCRGLVEISNDNVPCSCSMRCVRQGFADTGAPSGDDDNSIVQFHPADPTTRPHPASCRGVTSDFASEFASEFGSEIASEMSGHA